MANGVNTNWHWKPARYDAKGNVIIREHRGPKVPKAEQKKIDLKELFKQVLGGSSK